MKRYAVIVGGVLLALGALLYAQEPESLNGRPLQVLSGYFYTGAGVRWEMEGTTADAFEYRIVADPTADVVWTLPATQGSAGQQLQTTGGGDLSWASAASTREVKNLDGYLDPREALTAILHAPIHRFTYKDGEGTHDAVTKYAGIVADEAPWAMHFNGTILNPINTTGYAFAAIQAQQAEIEALKREIAALKRARR